MKKIVIIGGGLAGLSAAVHLSKNNLPVILLEASPKLGGRVYSFPDTKTSLEVDNGQHLLMSCYHDTFEFLELIGSKGKLKEQDKLLVNFVKASKIEFSLRARNLFYPLDILTAILSYKALTIKERIKIVDFFLDLVFCFEEDLRELSVLEWLRIKKQSLNAIKSFWEILCIGIMNSKMQIASAEQFAVVLKEIFFSGKANTKLVIPQIGLSKIFSEPAKKFLLNNSSKIFLSERVINVKRDGRFFLVKTTQRIIENVEYLISAVPHYTLKRIFINDLPENVAKIEFKYSPILTAHILLKNNPFDKEMYGLIDSFVHWIFNHGKHISVLISAAENLVTYTNSEIIEKIYWELNKFFPMFSKDLIINFLIINEKRATFIPEPKIIMQRKLFSNNHYGNLFFAGDWTNTGYPGTIEGAVKSGKLAAMNVIKKVSHIP